MDKLVKSIIFVCLMLVTLSNVIGMPKEDLIAYVSKEHIVSGKTYSLTPGQKVQVERYLNTNTVTHQQVNIFISKVEAIKNIMNISNVSDPNKLISSEKTKVMNLAIEAGSSIGIIVRINTSKEYVELLDSKGVILDVVTFTGDKLPFTGTTLELLDVFAAITTMCIVICIFKYRKKVV